MIRGASGDKFLDSILTYDSEFKQPRMDTIRVVLLVAKPATPSQNRLRIVVLKEKKQTDFFH